MQVAGYLFFGKMRKTCTVGGAYCVDGTLVISHVKKLAGLFFILPVTAGVMSRCAEIRLTSLGVNVGVIFLQQLPQLRQSVSCQTSLSAWSTILLMVAGGLFSSRVKNERIDFLYTNTFLRKERRLTIIIDLILLW
jgi:hypothetical protein